ncbi:MAG: hypothetical protein WBD19_14280, partial [Candidatus Acidiferrum sp.]
PTNAKPFGCGKQGKRVGGMRGRRVPPPVFCKRVRNELIWNELPKYSFWKSAQEIETEGVNFCRFLQKSEKECEECEERGEKTDRLLRLAEGDGFWMARSEVGGCGTGRTDFGSGISDENMEDFTTNIHLMSSQLSVTIRIEAEVIEGIGFGIVEIRARRLVARGWKGGGFD